MDKWFASAWGGKLSARSGLSLWIMTMLSVGCYAPVAAEPDRGVTQRRLPIGIVGDCSEHARVTARVVIGDGLFAGDSIAIVWEATGGTAISGRDTSYRLATASMRTRAAVFQFAGEGGSVCATVTLIGPDGDRIEEACLPVPGGGAELPAKLRGGRVVRSEVLVGGQRFRRDDGVCVPIASSRRLMAGQIRVRGSRARLIEAGPQSDQGEGVRLVEAIVCVDTLGRVTKVDPGESVEEAVWRDVLSAVRRMTFLPAFYEGAAVEDWVLVKVRTSQ